MTALKSFRIYNKLFINYSFLVSANNFNNKQYSTDEAALNKKRQQIMARGLPKVKPIEGVKKILLVASGKGGVGKSTTAVNLATALKILDPKKSIGILDADVFGPSIPLMMNLHDTPLLNKDNLMEPLVNYGIKCMSMGFLIEEGSPVIWRGLMVMQALEKLLRQVHWGDIDYLIVDTPPGTGDTHLSLLQNVPVAGVLLVTTPQSAALNVTKRGAGMFKKLNIPVWGLVENMSTTTCPLCSNEIQLFGKGGEELAAEIGTELLQKIPLEKDIGLAESEGVPVVISEPDCAQSVAYRSLAEKVMRFLVR